MKIVLLMLTLFKISSFHSLFLAKRQILCRLTAVFPKKSKLHSDLYN